MSHFICLALSVNIFLKCFWKYGWIGIAQKSAFCRWEQQCGGPKNCTDYPVTHTKKTAIHDQYFTGNLVNGKILPPKMSPENLSFQKHKIPDLNLNTEQRKLTQPLSPWTWILNLKMHQNFSIKTLKKTPQSYYKSMIKCLTTLHASCPFNNCAIQNKGPFLQTHPRQKAEHHMGWIRPVWVSFYSFH